MKSLVLLLSVLGLQSSQTNAMNDSDSGVSLMFVVNVATFDSF